MKTGIITICDNDNYGNRLQNYATQQILKKCNIKEVETIKNRLNLNNKKGKISYFSRKIKNYIAKFKKNRTIRGEKFKEFNKNINFTKRYFDFTISNRFKYDNLIIGSDQVWNPYYRLSDFDLANFTSNTNKVAFSASFGVSKLPENINKRKVANLLKDFKAISVREEAGKKIIEELTGREDIEVLVDPTMLLTDKEWDQVAKRPEQLTNKKYILNYFLGKLSEERYKEISRIARENDCEIINILDHNGPFYQTGPSEFLYLEKNAFLICTDSFHSCVFAILYNIPFVVFDREDSSVSMNSRIETLITKFKLKNRKFKTKITEENLEHDYLEAYKILDIERKKAKEFLENSLNL